MTRAGRRSESKAHDERATAPNGHDTVTQEISRTATPTANHNLGEDPPSPLSPPRDLTPLADTPPPEDDLEEDASAEEDDGKEEEEDFAMDSIAPQLTYAEPVAHETQVLPPTIDIIPDGPRQPSPHPPPVTGPLDFKFDLNASVVVAGPPTPTSPVHSRYKYDPKYTLPPLKSLPAEFQRRPTKVKRKRERERNGSSEVRKGEKEEFVPIGFNKWGAIVRANPVWKRVARASKCLTTRDWVVAARDLRVLRTVERVELMKDKATWTFRQPKKQRSTGIIAKTHWDHLLDEMVSHPDI